MNAIGAYNPPVPSSLVLRKDKPACATFGPSIMVIRNTSPETVHYFFLDFAFDFWGTAEPLETTLPARDVLAEVALLAVPLTLSSCLFYAMVR